MIAEGLPEGGHVVVAPLAGVVGSMYADAEVEADDEEAEVVAQADTRAPVWISFWTSVWIISRFRVAARRFQHQ